MHRYLETGSEEAFSELVRRHVDFVYGAALRMTRSPARAEDVTQGVFIDLSRKARSLCSRRDLSGWLYVSAHYTAINLIRRECRRELREHRASLAEHDSAPEPVGTEWSEVAPVLDAVLGQLGSKDREAILLRYFKNASFAEIGAILNLSENAARMRVGRALARARTILSRAGIASTAEAFELALTGQRGIAAPAAWAGALPGAVLAAAKARAAVTAAAGLWTLVNAGKSALLAAALIAIGGAGLVLDLKIRRAEADLRAADGELGRLRREWADARQAPDPHRPAARARSAGSDANPDDQASAGSGPDWAALIRDPAFQQNLLERSRGSLHRRYAAFYRERGFSPEQVSRFEKAVLKSQEADLDVSLSAASLGIARDDPGLGEMYARDREELAGDLQGLATLPQLQSYDQQEQGRDMAERLNSVLRETDSPLSQGQFDSIAQLIAAHTSAPATANAPASTDWAAVLAAAQPVLSPAQVSLLKSVGSAMDFAREKLDVELEAARLAIVRGAAGP
ncbi:MAG TPA: sigma-70 family RNA polymerase sigma factor [Opitutaceae bacterium]|nr:sigma-70 family RNA polymerase sigma factor [Opitutaceae bacterium]